MERSESADAWDEGDESEGYPVAPVPSHERTWRHPSEIGHATWIATEPPVVIGRGLMVTTGAIGCVLGVAVLWLLTPVGGGLAPSAAPIATSSVTTSRLTGATSTSTLVGAAPTTLNMVSNPVTLPAEDIPSNTVLVMEQESSETRSIAVAIGDTPFIVTTALAVTGIQGVSLMSNGAPTDGIVTISGDLAYIQPNESIEVIGFEAVAEAVAGQELLVLGAKVATITFDAAGIGSLDAESIIEGTPVVDLDGALVALCTLVIDSSGAQVELLPTAGLIEPVAPTDTTVVTDPPDNTGEADASGWLGVRFIGGTGDDALTITAVASASPAADAGLRAGDRITAINGVAVSTVDEVLSAISSKPPGTVVTLTVIGVIAVADPVPITSAAPTSALPTSTTTVPPPTTTVPPPTTTVVSATTAANGSVANSTPSLGGAPGARLVTVVLGAYEPTV